MNRRHLLSLGGASALALTLPLPAIASVSAFDYSGVPIHEFELIEHALDVAVVYKFPIDRQAGLFGFEPDAVGNFNDLRRLVQEYAIGYGGRDMWRRILMLLAIREEMDRRYGRDNISAQLRWLHNNDAIWGRATFLDMMWTGAYMDLRSVALGLGYNIG